jgi:cold shock CspA family protein/ribosome-associated translation inhibitor RaiA
MKIPLKIVFRGLRPSEAVKEKAQERAEELDQFSPMLVRCEVWIESDRGHHRKGRRYTVRVRATAPGEELDIDRQPPQEDVYVAIRDAFDAMRRRLEDHQRKFRGDVKTHREIARAMVSGIFPEKGYGFLRTPDGREVYFQRASVQNAPFDDIRLGSEVTFAEEPGEKGPQATIVNITVIPDAVATSL